MPKVEQHAPGMFCWVELSTSSQESAKSFYSALFGWVATDFPTGPDQTYTIFSLNGSDVAAAYTASVEERAMVSPHWNLYVAVANADDAAARKCGGSILDNNYGVRGVVTLRTLRATGQLRLPESVG